MRWVNNFGCLKALKAWLSDRRGTVSVDFIVSIPILLAVLVLTSEYGRVLQARSTLDNAVADATRYLARVQRPVDSVTFDPAIIDIAEGLIRSRMNTRYIVIGTPNIDESGVFSTIELSAAVGVITPALQVLGVGSPSITLDGKPLKDVQGLILTSTDTARYFGR